MSMSGSRTLFRPSSSESVDYSQNVSGDTCRYRVVMSVYDPRGLRPLGA